MSKTFLEGNLATSHFKTRALSYAVTRIYLVGATVRKQKSRESPGGPVVRTPHFHCRGPRFDPWLGN